MNKQTVGMENLPNVYIDNINVIPNDLGPNGTQYNIKVTIMMIDDALDKTWFGKIDDLKIKCSFIRDDRSEQLNSGEISLFDIVPGAINGTVVRSTDDFYMYKREAGYDYYREFIEISIINPVNLSVYVAAFVDGLGFGIPLFDKFYGPMSAERIFVGGQINSESGYFYYPDTNEEYGGPVHSHNQGYMEGSRHSSDPHSELAYVPEENYKITSYQELDLDVFAGLDTGMSTGLSSIMETVILDGAQTPGGPQSGYSVNPPDPINYAGTPTGTTRTTFQGVSNELENPLKDLDIIFPNQLIKPPGGY